MKQGRKFLTLAMALSLLVVGCELFEAEPEEETKKVDNTTYTYSYTCATGKKYTIQINKYNQYC